MFKGYTIINSEAHVKDQYGQYHIENYTENLDEILITQNLIEELNIEYDKVTEKIEKIKNELMYNKRLSVISLISILVLALITILTFCLGLFETIVPLCIIDVFALTLSFTTLAQSINGMKTNTKEYNSLSDYRNEVDHLVNINKTKVQELKQLSILKHSTNRISKTVKDKEKLIELKSKLEFLKNLAYNIERYVKYYQKGTLDKELNNTFTEEQINKIKDIIDDNCLTLRRKK